MGTSFEMVCLKHNQNIKDALGLQVISTETTTWHCNPNEQENTPGAQIDMVIERADRIIHLCEIKFSIDKYNISKDYENRLRERVALFRYLTKNKKSLVHTLIPTYGVANGKNTVVKAFQPLLNQLNIRTEDNREYWGFRIMDARAVTYLSKSAYREWEELCMMRMLSLL